MQFKHFAALLIVAALLSTDKLTAQTTATPSGTTTTKPAEKKPADKKPAEKKADKNSTDPASLSWKQNKKAAKKLIKAGKIEEATPYLEAGAKKNPKKVYFADNLTRVEIGLRNYKASNMWHKVMMDKDSLKHKHPEYLFGFALTQKYLGQYEEAKKNFEKYKKLAGDKDEAADLKKRATREIMGCDKGIYYRDSVTNRAFKVKHLDATVNQSITNFAPVAKDNALYFNSVKGDSKVIYKSTKTGNQFGPATDLAAEVNVAGADVSAPTFTADGNTMYYTVCPKDKGEKVKVKCAIYKSSLVGGAWDKGVSAGALTNDPLVNNMQPAVGKNKDGEDVVYFVSDRNTGKGTDIFYSKINTDGTLGKPRSVGSIINSKGDETTPYFDAKNKILYFSSNGLISIGGLDVFKTSWDANGDWTEPENMGTPINSSVDDYYFSLNDKGTLGYEASNRVGASTIKCETCSDDIYMVQTTKLYLAVKGNVYEEQNDQRVPSQGSVSLYDDRNGTDLGAYNLINGGYFFDLEPKRGYKVLSRRDGYLDAIATFNTDNNTESDTAKYDLFLKKKEVANPLLGRIIGRIYYDYDQARLRADSRDSLKKIMDIMNQFPNTVIEVGAHTDGKGTEEYNIALSKKRADAVMNYYIHEKKIDKARLSPKAYGTSQPAASNTLPNGKDDPKGRALNRRTEFKIIDELKPGSVQEKLAEPVAEPKKAPAKKDEPVAKVVKKDIGTGKKAETVPANGKVESPYKAAPSASVVLKGKVYVDKGGKKLLATEAGVFLSSDDKGFEQQVSFINKGGGYSFDLTRATAKTFKLVARKDKLESDVVTFNLDDLKANNKPIDLTIKSK